MNEARYEKEGGAPWVRIDREGGSRGCSCFGAL